MIICPKCKQKLNIQSTLLKENNSYKCINGHTYDISKEGYINLLDSKTGSGDNEILIKARELFLSKGYYDNLRDEIINIINELNIKTFLDCGCGTGYYTEKCSDNIIQGYGLDISKQAIKVASKKHNKNKNIFYFVSSSKDIPLKDKSVDLILNIFAPYFNNEFSRVLKDNGYLIIVSSNDNHLYELKQLIYDNPYYNDHTGKEVIKLDSFTLIDEKKINYHITVNNEDLMNLFMMTPYYYKTKEKDINKLNHVNTLDITVSFNISVLKLNN